jgi:uncharacterized membrane protein AbrB (regulator of aidB expression)
LQELVPLVSGFAVGLALGWLQPALRLPVGALLAVVLGTLATVVTGEFEVSWGFLLVDIPLVAAAATCGVLVARRAAWRAPRTR